MTNPVSNTQPSIVPSQVPTDPTSLVVKQTQASTGVDVLSYVATTAGKMNAEVSDSVTAATTAEVGGMATLVNTLQGAIGNSSTLSSIQQDVTQAQALLSANKPLPSTLLTQLTTDYQSLNQLASNTSATTQSTYWGQVQTFLQNLGNTALVQQGGSLMAQSTTEAAHAGVFQQYWQGIVTPSAQPNINLGSLLKDIIVGSQATQLNTVTQNLNFCNWTTGVYKCAQNTLSALNQANEGMTFSSKTVASPTAIPNLPSPQWGRHYASLPLDKSTDSLSQSTSYLNSYSTYTSLVKAGKLNATPPAVYAGSMSDAQTALQNEINYVKTGGANCTAVIAQLKASLSALSPPGTDDTSLFVSDPTYASQITTMKTQITAQISSLQGTQQTLNQLSLALQQVTVGSPPEQVWAISVGDVHSNVITQSYVDGTVIKTGYTSSDHYCLTNVDGTPFTGTVQIVTATGTQSVNVANSEHSLLASSGVPNLMSGLNTLVSTAQQAAAAPQAQMSALMTQIQNQWSQFAPLLQNYNAQIVAQQNVKK